MNKIWIWLSVLLIAALVLGACAPATTGPEPPPEEETGGETTTTTGEDFTTGGDPSDGEQDSDPPEVVAAAAAVVYQPGQLFRGMEISRVDPGGWNVVSKGETGTVAFQELEGGLVQWRRMPTGQFIMDIQLEALQAQARYLGFPASSFYLEGGMLYSADLGVPFREVRKILGWQKALEHVQEYGRLLEWFYQEKQMAFLDVGIRNIVVDLQTGKVATPDMGWILPAGQSEYPTIDHYRNYMWREINDDWEFWLMEYGDEIDFVQETLEDAGKAKFAEAPEYIPRRIGGASGPAVAAADEVAGSLKGTQPKVIDVEVVSPGKKGTLWKRLQEAGLRKPSGWPQIWDRIKPFAKGTFRVLEVAGFVALIYFEGESLFVWGPILEMRPAEIADQGQSLEPSYYQLPFETYGLHVQSVWDHIVDQSQRGQPPCVAFVQLDTHAFNVVNDHLFPEDRPVPVVACAEGEPVVNQPGTMGIFDPQNLNVQLRFEFDSTLSNPQWVIRNDPNLTFQVTGWDNWVCDKQVLVEGPPMWLKFKPVNCWQE